MLSLLWHQIQRTLDLVFDLYRWCGSLGLQLSLGWFAPECEAAGMRSSTFKSEAVVLSQKSAHSVSGMELLLQVEEFKYVAVLWGKSRVGDWQIGVDAEERGECQFKPVNLQVVATLTYGHELWWRKEWDHWYKWRKWISSECCLGSPLEIESGAATLLHRKEPAEVAKASDQDAFEMPPKRRHPFRNDNFGLPLLSFYFYYFIFIPIAFLI